MKLLCIKSMSEPSGHHTVTHIVGKVYTQNTDKSIIDEYGNRFWWDDDMIEEFFKPISEIREEKLNDLGI